MQGFLQSAKLKAAELAADAEKAATQIAASVEASLESPASEPLLVAVGFVRDGSNEFLQMEDAGLSAEAVSERARMALDVLAVTKARVSAPGASRPLHPSPCITDDETLRDT